jgi:hypothetical protein
MLIVKKMIKTILRFNESSYGNPANEAHSLQKGKNNCMVKLDKYLNWMQRHHSCQLQICINVSERPTTGLTE